MEVYRRTLNTPLWDISKILSFFNFPDNFAYLWCTVLVEMYRFVEVVNNF